MKTKFKVLALVLVAAFVCLALVGCSTVFDGYDDDDKIRNSSTSVFVGQSSTNFGGVKTLNVSGGFGGATTIFGTATLTEHGSISMTLEYKSGKLKVVAIAEDNTIYTLLENESCDGELKTELPAGKYKIRLVGSEAVFNLSY